MRRADLKRESLNQPFFIGSHIGLSDKNVKRKYVNRTR